VPTAQWKQRFRRRCRPEEGPKARLSSKRGVQTRHPREQKEERKAVMPPSFSRRKHLGPNRAPSEKREPRSGRESRPGEGPKARLSSKRGVQTRHPREQKEERKAVMPPSFSREST
jgi:hypothetical protein